MCLAIPGKLRSMSGDDPLSRVGVVSFGGVQRDVNLAMVPEAKIGDYLLVHVGVAIGVVDEAEAKRTLEYLREMEMLGAADDK